MTNYLMGLVGLIILFDSTFQVSIQCPMCRKNSTGGVFITALVQMFHECDLDY